MFKDFQGLELAWEVTFWLDGAEGEGGDQVSAAKKYCWQIVKGNTHRIHVWYIHLHLP